MKASSEPILELIGVDAGRDGRAVVTGAHLACRAGEVLAIAGPNGAGKSTLLMTLAGALPPIAGEALLRGKSLNACKLRERAQAIAYVPQRDLPAPGLTIGEVVAMGRTPHLQGLWESADDRAAIEEALRRSRLDGWESRAFAETSGGEQQAAIVARALAQQSPVLLLDEPTAHMDYGRQAWLADVLRQEAESGKAVVTVVHDLAWAADLADQIALVGEGRITWSGKPEDAHAHLTEAYGWSFEEAATPEGRRFSIPRRTKD